MSTTSASQNSSRLVFTGAGQVHYESFAVPAPEAGQVRVRTERTLLSTGTETIVFNRSFDPGTHWDGWVKYPFYPGYAAVGIVTDVGEGSGAHKVGDRVVWRGHHQGHDVVGDAQCWAVPEGVAPTEAVWFALAKITAMGARAAKHRLGESVLVIGAGPIGQMAVRWAAATAPRKLLVVDPVAMRLKLALAGGATDVLDKSIETAKEDVRRLNGGELPDLVIDTTGNAGVFRQALGMARNHGRVLLLGDTGRPDGQHLTSDVVIRGIRIVGAHDSHEDASWNTTLITELLFALVRRSRFNLCGLNTHEFSPGQCVEAYRLASERRAETMGILFNWG